MYALSKINCHILQHNDTPHIVMRDVQKCTPPCSSLRDRNVLPLCCIIYRTATDAVYGAGGILAVAYNPVPHNWGKRTPLAVSISDDNGKTFCDSVYLECGEGEFSYPSITVEENIFHVIYTINRKTFGYCQLEYLL